jgi:hypothetical protein
MARNDFTFQRGSMLAPMASFRSAFKDQLAFTVRPRTKFALAYIGESAGGAIDLTF